MEFLFSVMDINTSEVYNFVFKYKYEKEFVEVDPENLKVDTVGNIIYFLVKGNFFTDFIYNFEMHMTSLNGDIVCFTYENHLVRGKFYKLIFPIQC